MLMLGEWLRDSATHRVAEVGDSLTEAQVNFLASRILAEMEGVVHRERKRCLDIVEEAKALHFACASEIERRIRSGEET
jgi:hypothetical protein